MAGSRVAVWGMLGLLAITQLGASSLGDSADWSSLKDALLRPGTRVLSDLGECTAGFLFTDTSSVYVAVAASCVPGLTPGDAVRLVGDVDGTLAYSSTFTMAAVGETDEATRAGNDFALVRIDRADRDLVHPALLQYGGPTGVAGTGHGLRTLVHTYGASSLRPDGTHARDGTLVTEDAWTSTAYFATPAIMGDAGSAVIKHDGTAVGIVTTLRVTPPGSNGIVGLDAALEYAREHGGPDVTLATWPLL